MKSDELLSLAERSLVHKEAVRAAVLAGRRTPLAFPLGRVLAPVLGALLLAAVTVLSIPPARAEVLSWFRAKSTAEYLLEPKEERTGEELNAMIVPQPEPSGQARVLSVAEEPIWQEIAEDFSVTLDETMYDGTSLLVTVRMKGLSMLPLLEWYTATGLTKTAVLPEYAPAYFEDGDPKVPDYRNGRRTLYVDAEPILTLTLPDGLELRETLTLSERSESMRSLLDRIRAMEKQYGADGEPAEEYRAAAAALLRSFCRTAEETAIVRMELSNLRLRENGADVSMRKEALTERLRANADENGLLIASVKLQYRGDDGEAFHELLAAELGTAAFDLGSAAQIAHRTLIAEGPVVFGDKTVIVTERMREAHPGAEDTATVCNRSVSLRGLKLEVLGPVGCDARGIGSVTLCITPPADWTERERALLEQGMLQFVDEIDGERLGAYSGHTAPAQQPDGTYRMTLYLEYAPLERTGSMQTLRLIPYVAHVTEVDLNEEGTERAALLPGVPTPERYAEALETAEFPAYALTLRETERP